MSFWRHNLNFLLVDAPTIWVRFTWTSDIRELVICPCCHLDPDMVSCKFHETPSMIVLFHNGMVMGDSSTREQASELRVSHLIETRRQICPGIFEALHPTTKSSDQVEWTEKKKSGRKKKRKEERRRRKKCRYRVCSLHDVLRETWFLFFRFFHNYAMIVRAFVIWEEGSARSTESTDVRV